LTENQQTQARLHEELAQAQRQLQAGEQAYLDQRGRLEERSKLLQAQQGEIVQKVASLSQSLAANPKTELEAELTQHQQEEVRLQQQLKAVQTELEALKENYFNERNRLETQIGELQTERADVEQQVKSLTEKLAFETKRREAVERMAVDAFSGVNWKPNWQANNRWKSNPKPVSSPSRWANPRTSCIASCA